ncbi:hypothetical protein [Acinetobacter sp. RF14B]|uniref:hypothetical protein n=1 Tax=Acinetobacter sp. RF14B TaxID=2650965 RepID=UPI001167AB2B|nr:hypothetical protein [Acinetobacter sp. RF14B]TQR65934.1 hypothetical protein E2K52_05960 [Acinetobacter sp. RF14B]
MKKLLLLAVSATFSVGAWANCPTKTQTIFQCITTNNKTIQVCDAGKNIKYSFGKINQAPELAVAVLRNKVTTYQWEGIGRYENYSVNIPNGNHLYRVFSSIDKINQSHSAGVEISRSGDLITTVDCAPSKKIINNLIGVELQSED